MNALYASVYVSVCVCVFVCVSGHLLWHLSSVSPEIASAAAEKANEEKHLNALSFCRHIALRRWLLQAEKINYDLALINCLPQYRLSISAFSSSSGVSMQPLLAAPFLPRTFPYARRPFVFLSSCPQSWNHRRIRKNYTSTSHLSCMLYAHSRSSADCAQSWMIKSREL